MRMSKNINNKKAQVTVFILAGMIFVIIAGVSFFLMSESNLIDDSFVTDVSPELRSLNFFVQNCIEQTSIEGLKIISKNGGYIHPLDGMRLSPETHKTDVVVDGPNKLPYWYYYDEHSKSFSSKSPPLFRADGSDSIQEQLEGYVESNLGFCLDNFKLFADRFEISSEDPQVDIMITDSGLSIDTFMPVTASSSVDIVHSLENFYVEVPTIFKRMYSFASDVSRTQALTGFLERPVLEAIFTYSGVGRELPPPYEVELFSSSGDYWMREPVHDFIKRNVLSKVSKLQILYTQNFELSTSANENFKSNFKEVSMQDIIEPSDDYIDFTINFMHPMNTNPYIQVGSGGSIMRPDSAEPDFAGIFSRLLGAAVRVYRFNYDMSYPVIARICEEESFGGKGLCFYFSLEGNIRFNEPFLPSTVDYGDLFGHTTGESDFVDFKDVNQYVDKIVEFDVVDKYDGSAINDVMVYYSCGSEVFVDRIYESGGISKFRGKLPFCAAGGRIILRKTGYHSAVFDWNNREDSSYADLPDMEMYRTVDIPFDVFKRDHLASFGSDSLSEMDQVILQISQLKSYAAGDDFPLIQTFVLGNSSVIDDDFSDVMVSLLSDSVDSVDDEIAGYALQNILEGEMELSDLDNLDRPTLHSMSLIPGEYEISLTYIMSGSPALNIPPEKRYVCVNGDVGEDGFCFIELSSYVLPEINMPSWVVSEINYIWEIDEEIYDAEALQFYVPDISPPSRHKDFESYSTDHINVNRFMPEFGEIDE